jgi:hypothetical protein
MPWPHGIKKIILAELKLILSVVNGNYKYLNQRNLSFTGDCDFLY